jgi:hypothetical protein
MGKELESVKNIKQSLASLLASHKGIDILNKASPSIRSISSIKTLKVRQAPDLGSNRYKRRNPSVLVTTNNNLLGQETA